MDVQVYTASNSKDETLKRFANGVVHCLQIRFQSSTMTNLNILAHVRFNEREVNGESVLFLEEVQSDFSQSLKKKEDLKNY